MTYGRSTLVLEPAGHGYVRFHLVNSGTPITWPSAVGWKFPIPGVTCCTNSSRYL